jgi:hypothetical protein
MPSGGQQVNATMLTDLGENTVGPGLEKAPAGIRGPNQVVALNARLIAVRDQLIAEQTEIDRIDRRERRQVADTEADRVTMASRRWANVAPDSDVVPGNGGKK